MVLAQLDNYIKMQRSHFPFSRHFLLKLEAELPGLISLAPGVLVCGMTRSAWALGRAVCPGLCPCCPMPPGSFTLRQRITSPFTIICLVPVFWPGLIVALLPGMFSLLTLFSFFGNQ